MLGRLLAVLSPRLFGYVLLYLGRCAVATVHVAVCGIGSWYFACDSLRAATFATLRQADHEWMTRARARMSCMEHAKMLVRVLTRCMPYFSCYFSCLKHVNEMVLGKSRQAHQRSERKASASHRHSSITRPCCSSAQAPSAPSFLSLQSCTRTLDRL